MGILQFRFWHVDVRRPFLFRFLSLVLTNGLQVLYNGQRGREASAPHRNIEPARRALRVRDIAQMRHTTTDFAQAMA